MKTKTEEILYLKVSLSPCPPPKIILKDTWQVQSEACHQRGNSTGRLVGKIEPNIDLRVHGLPHAAVEQEEDDRIRLFRRFVHQVQNHPNKDALIADLQSNLTYKSLQPRIETDGS